MMTLQEAINFVVPNDRVLVATLPLSSLQNISTSDTICVALRSMPGEEFEATISDIPPATREGALDARSGLPSLRELAGATDYVVVADIPEEQSAKVTKLGASGTGLVITEDAGAISVLAEILFWLTKKLNYL